MTPVILSLPSLLTPEGWMRSSQCTGFRWEGHSDSYQTRRVCKAAFNCFIESIKVPSKNSWKAPNTGHLPMQQNTKDQRRPSCLQRGFPNVISGRGQSEWNWSTSQDPRKQSREWPNRNRSCIRLLHIRCLEENAISNCKATVIYLTPNSMYLMSNKHDGK